MNNAESMFLMIGYLLSVSILVVALILINNIDDRTCDIKEMLKDLEQKLEGRQNEDITQPYIRLGL